MFSNKIVKIEILDSKGALVVTATKNIVFPKNIETDEESILIIKGVDLHPFNKGDKVHIIATTKAGVRIKYPGQVSLSMSNQLNVQIVKSRDTQVLEERRRYFKIKVQEKGRALFLIRGEETLRFDEPIPISIQDINIGGIFMVTDDYVFEREDAVCVDIDLFIDYRLNAMARVLRIQKDADGSITGYGCEFQGLTASQEDYIGKYIYKAQFTQRQMEMAKGMDDD